jgi:hypothetical protein
MAIHKEHYSEITVRGRKFGLLIDQDEGAENPRMNSKSSLFFIHTQPRYSFPQECVAIRNKEEYTHWNKTHFIFPLSCYEHSGISFSLCEKMDNLHAIFNVGYILVPRENEQENPYTFNDARLIATAELEEYNQYLNGDVYRFVLEEELGYATTYSNGRKTSGKEWVLLEIEDGFFGSDHYDSGLLRAANDALETRFKLDGSRLPKNKFFK